MSMAKYVQTALEKYGSTVQIIRSDERIRTKAFIQPLRRRHRLYISEKLIPQGYFDNGYQLYIGDAKCRLCDESDTVISSGGVRYTALVDEVFSIGSEQVYVWAILMPMAGQKENDYDSFG